MGLQAGFISLTTGTAQRSHKRSAWLRSLSPSSALLAGRRPGRWDRVRRRCRARLPTLRLSDDSPASSNDAAVNHGEGGEHQREELALQAERARLEAERAALDAERAKLEAERARIESEKFRLSRQKLHPREGEGTRSPTPTSNAPTAEAADTTSDKTPATPASSGNARSEVERARQTLREMLESGTLDEASLMLLSRMGPLVLGGGISDADLKALQEQVFGERTFRVSRFARTPVGIVFRGELRMASPADAYSELARALTTAGLDERVRLFMVEDPAATATTANDRTGDEDRLSLWNVGKIPDSKLYEPKKPDAEAGSDSVWPGPPPIVVAMPTASQPAPPGFAQYAAAFLIGGLALFTTFGYGVGVFGMSPDFMKQIAGGNLDIVTETYPVSFGALFVTVAHELAHRVAAAAHNVRLGLSYAVPSLQIGTYGCITPLKSFPRDRNALFDVAVSGPLIGVGVSLAALVAGLALTAQQGGATLDWFPQVPSSLFNSSLLIGSLGKWLLPASALAQQTIAVHPLCVVGYTGLLSQALQLLPVGRSDGGRMMQAIYGRRIAGRVTGITLILQGLSSIFGNSPLLLFYGLVLIFLQREAEIPCSEEVTEPDNVRTVVSLVLLATTLLILAPFPAQLGDVTGQF
ncbi:hypothetical protein CDCA_CDCA03G1119 [Cyanidium caldarium]|uniref:Peptidase M50 domain-containing protein n=1 Tax=Cyanidium caldarium TaxID=2771 RepID=A0AAV9IS14_CYACA|nr:hypothetical protein CDCA_CDCA03G1119 [Cyanidium caldarium]